MKTLWFSLLPKMPPNKFRFPQRRTQAFEPRGKGGRLFRGRAIWTTRRERRRQSTPARNAEVEPRPKKNYIIAIFDNKIIVLQVNM